MVMKKIKNVMKIEVLAGPELFIIVGLVMVLGTLLKLLGIVDFSSDWFWFIAAIGLVVEGLILLSKKKRYNHRYVAIKTS